MISVIYSCMNREKNLVKSLSSWLDIPQITEFIIVDWSSNIPIKQNNFIHKLINKNKKNIKLIRVNNQKFFSLPKSYNLAVQYAQNKILLKLDTDYVNINSNWMQSLVFKNQELDNYFITGYWKFSGPLNGFLLINKKDFLFYNENFKGWGWEDTDLYNRVMQTQSIEKIHFFNITDYIYHIPHTDTERTVNYECKDRIESHKYNKSISSTNFQVSNYKTIVCNKNYIEVEEIK